MPPSILVVDDEVDAAILMRDLLRKDGYIVDYVVSGIECLDRLAIQALDIVITDVAMPGLDGVQLCAQIHDRYPDVLSIVVTGMAAIETAVAAIRAGAYDFLTKPVNGEVLRYAVRRAVEHSAMALQARRLGAQANRHELIDGIIGTSPAIRKMTATIRQVADTDATVMITGESGTGKELVARALHATSRRAAKPFVAVNCSAMPGSLLESELFGHVRGAFTDARTDRDGLFVRAGHGTLFLDEIGEMPMDMQVKLLRVLQERTVRQVGSDTEARIECRVIAATNRDLATEVAERRFREDLYYRLDVMHVTVPPLRERTSDISALVDHVLRRIAARTGKPVRELDPQAARRLIEYDWPGNVRELENVLEGLVASAQSHQISFAALPPRLQRYKPRRIELDSARVEELITLEEFRHRYTNQVLASVGGNKTKAGRVLGIDRRSIYRILELPSGTAPDEQTRMNPGDTPRRE